ncbi:MAG TPA: hypothetical protein VK858_14035, partial [Longimicrobiales bacterium]|nr:hypothetical protein [Longimicrobiales bacterium]
MRRILALLPALLPACGGPLPDRSPGLGSALACPVPGYVDLVAPDGRPLAIDLGDVLPSGPTALLLGPQVVTQATPDSLALHRNWLGGLIDLTALAGDSGTEGGELLSEPVPVPPGVEPPTLLRGGREGDGWRVFGTSPLPGDAPGTRVWTARLDPVGWSDLTGVTIPDATPPQVGASELQRSLQGCLLALPAGAPGRWRIVHLGTGGLEVFDLSTPLVYLVPLRLDGSTLDSVWVEPQPGGPSVSNSLVRGVLPLEDGPALERRLLLRRGTGEAVHHPRVDVDSRAVGLVSGPLERSRAWLVPLEGPEGEAAGAPAIEALPGVGIEEIRPVSNADATPAGHGWITVSAGPSPRTVTWLT